MSEERLRALVEQVSRGELSPDDALQQLSRFPIDELPYAQVDHLRPLLQGYPEVVLCQGKTTEQVLGICESLEATSDGFLATRADAAVQEALRERFPRVQVNALARTALLTPDAEPAVTGTGLILVVTAGVTALVR